MLNDLVGIDLHSHSTASDGTLSPNELVKRAFENDENLLYILYLMKEYCTFNYKKY